MKDQKDKHEETSQDPAKSAGEGELSEQDLSKVSGGSVEGGHATSD